MSDRKPFPSVAAIGDDIGRLIISHFEVTVRQLLSGPNAEQEPRFIRLLTGEPHPLGNLAVVSDPDDLEGTRAAIGPLVECGAPAAVVFAGSTVGKPVLAHVRAQGFTHDEPLPAMAVDIERMSATALPDGYEFARIRAGDDVEAWTRVFAEGYELPLAVAKAFSPEAVGLDDAPDAAAQFFVVFKNANPVGTSMMYLQDGVAGIYCVATIPDERGRGVGAYATAEPLRIAHRLGYRVGVLQSSESGHPVYRRLGFADYGTVPLYIRMPAE